MNRNIYTQISKHLEPWNVAKLKATSRNAASSIPKISETELVESFIKDCIKSLHWNFTEDWEGLGVALVAVWTPKVLSPILSFPKTYDGWTIEVMFIQNGIVDIFILGNGSEINEEVIISYDSTTGNLTFDGIVSDDPYPHHRYIYKWLQAIYESARNALPSVYPIQITQNGGKYKKHRSRKSQK